MVNCDTAVCITIIGKAYIQSMIYNIFLQNFDMCGTAVSVDVCSIRLIVDHISLGSQRIKYTLAIAEELPLEQSRPILIFLKSQLGIEIR